MTREIEQLERESEQARRRLVESLGRLRGRDDMQNVGERARATGGKLVRRATGQARRRADGLLDAIKARVAANPGAALAIGGGLAWRLYRHPPIATILIGAGLASLLRTDPDEPKPGARLAGRAGELAESLQERVEEWREDPAREARRLKESARRQAAHLADSARRDLGALAETAKEQVVGWAAEAGEMTQRRARQAAEWSAAGRRRVAKRMPTTTRDQYLLGAAALALVSAVGIAGSRRALSARAGGEKSGRERQRPRRPPVETAQAKARGE
jgi:hypothetical protein